MGASIIGPIDHAIQPGRRLGAYRIDAPLGQGGMGTVYRAFDTTLQRPVAIKVLSEADEQARSKLLAEARAAPALDHPNICTVHEVGEADGQPYIVMALVEGKPLCELIPSDGLPPETVIRYGLQIAESGAGLFVQDDDDDEDDLDDDEDDGSKDEDEEEDGYPFGWDDRTPGWSD